MKKWYKSRTLWANALAAVAMFIERQYGFGVPVELQLQLLAAVNIVLRLDTDSGLSK